MTLSLDLRTKLNERLGIDAAELSGIAAFLQAQSVRLGEALERQDDLGPIVRDTSVDLYEISVDLSVLINQLEESILRD
jgi:hypothetical protein